MSELVIANQHKVRSWATIEEEGFSVRVPLGRSYEGREPGPDRRPIDVCLERNVDLVSGLIVEISIMSDGAVRWMETKSSGSNDASHANRYWHFSRGGDVPENPPTPAQRRVLAEIWSLKGRAPFGLGSLGSPVCQWAFRGYTPQSLAAELGEPAPVLNGAEHHERDTSIDRSPWQKGDNQP